MKSGWFLTMIFVFGTTACNLAGTHSDNLSSTKKSSANNSNTVQAVASPAPIEMIKAQESNQPKSVREYFLLLPKEYWGLECCTDKRGKEYQKALEDYIKDPNFAVVIDEKNGYMEGDSDGAQYAIHLALFKRPDGTCLIGLERFGQGEHDNFFLNYKDGQWTEVQQKVIPGYNGSNFYQMPHYGTMVQVFKGEYNEPENPDIREKGKKLYNLVWKDGKFTIQK
jgi:hypothetical protein